MRCEDVLTARKVRDADGVVNPRRTRFSEIYVVVPRVLGADKLS
jgi:hypothetical protein